MKKGLPRRTFLKYTLASLVGGISAMESRMVIAAVTAFSNQGLNGPLNYYTFLALVGQTFKLVVVKKNRKYAVRMKLTEVVSVALTPGNDQFYLVFQIFSKALLPGGVYPIHHASAGSTKLFLQPMGDDVVGNFVRADFNLLT